MNKLILTVGISGSGKTTWASSQDLPVVSRDQIRNMLFGYTDEDISLYYQRTDYRDMENIVTDVQNTAIRGLLNKSSVIVDNTHLKREYIDAFLQFGVPIEFKVFDTPLRECIARDAARARSVGTQLIKKQQNFFKELLRWNVLPEKSTVYFTSDIHYSHKNICAGTSKWGPDSKTRPFQSLQEMNSALLTAANTVGKYDVLYNLGDVAFGDPKNVEDFVGQLWCKTVHLILGNHDQVIEENLPYYSKMFASISKTKSIELLGERLELSHFPPAIWDKSHKGAIALHGHTHGSMAKSAYKIMDVGVDTGNFYKPYSIEQILKIMKGREILHGVSHHNKNTN